MSKDICVLKFKLYILDLFCDTYIECLRNNSMNELTSILSDKLCKSKYYEFLLTSDYVDVLYDVIKMYNIKYPEFTSKIINNVIM